MYVYCVHTAMPCIYKILKCTHKRGKHVTFCFNLYLGVHGAIPVSQLRITLRSVSTFSRHTMQRFICTPLYNQ